MARAGGCVDRGQDASGPGGRWAALHHQHLQLSSVGGGAVTEGSPNLPSPGDRAGETKSELVGDPPSRGQRPPVRTPTS